MRIIPLCLLSFMAAAAPLSAQLPGPRPAPDLGTRSLEDLMAVEVDRVVGAARHEQRVTEAPSSVTVVTAEDIRAFGWQTLAEVLGSVRGFYTTYDRNYTYVGVRGFGLPSDYNNRVLVLVNGHRFNDNVYDQALVATEFPVDLALVDRVEIIRGPGSALYGTSAFFAVVNVILKGGAAVGAPEAAIELGSAQTFRARATYGARTAGGGEALLSVSRLNRDGHDLLSFPEYDDPDAGPGVSREADRDVATSVYGAWAAGRFSLQGAFGERSKQLPTGAYGTTLGDARNRTTDSRAWIDASVTGRLREVDLTARAFVDYAGYRGTYIMEGAQTENRDASDGAWLGGELMASRRVRTRHRLTTGVEYRYNLRQDQANWDVDPYQVVVDSRRRGSQVGLFVQDEIALHRRLTATVGGRYDWWQEGVSTGRPRLGLVYRTDADTAIKVLYGAAYRAPSMFERYYYATDAEAGAALEPEQVETVEVAYERYVGRRLRLTATAYFTDADGLIMQGGHQDELTFHNQGKAHSKGLELEAERRWVCGVLLRAHYVTQRTRQPATGLEQWNSPRSMGSVAAAVPLLSRRMMVAAEQQFVGDRLTAVADVTPSVWLTHVNLTYTLKPGLSIGGHLTNLFDRQYGHPVGLEFRQRVMPQDGRAAAVRAAVRF